MGLARDLGTLRDAIAGPLADLDPTAALSRMLDFIAPAHQVFAVFDTGDVEHGGRVIVAARYRGTDIFGPSTSDPVEIFADRAGRLRLVTQAPSLL